LLTIICLLKQRNSIPPLQKQRSITKLGCEIFDFFFRIMERKENEILQAMAHTLLEVAGLHEC
jgi:hypothetical protein